MPRSESIFEMQSCYHIEADVTTWRLDGFLQRSLAILVHGLAQGRWTGDRVSPVYPLCSGHLSRDVGPLMGCNDILLSEERRVRLIASGDHLARMPL